MRPAPRAEPGPRADLATPGFRLARLGLALVLGLLWTATAAVAAADRPPVVRTASDVGGLEARSAALVLSGQQGGDLAASVLVVPFPGRDPEMVRLVLVLDLAADSLTAPASADERSSPGDDRQPDDAHPPEAARKPPQILEIHAYALGPEDTLASHLTQAMELAPGELEGKAGVKFLAALEVPPGEWSVRILVRLRDQGRMALRTLTVTAPGFGSGEGRAILLPPLFADPPDRWVLVHGAGETGGVPFPLDLAAFGEEKGWLVPSTRPVIEPAGRAFYLLGRDLPRRTNLSRRTERPKPAGAGSSEDGVGPWIARTYETGTEPRGDTEAAGTSGGAPAGATAALRVRRLGTFTGGPDAPGHAGLDLWLAELDPETLVSGAGTLVITAPTGHRASLPAVVLPSQQAAWEETSEGAAESGSAGTRLWTDFLGSPIPVPVEPRPAPRTVEAEEITDEELARFQVAYLQALTHLAAGDRPATLTAVMEVERSGLARGTATEILAHRQLQVALDVSGGAVGRLLPLVELHQELYREHLERGRRSLAAHARRVILGLVELYSQHSEDRDRGRVAAAALLGLAAQLLEHGNTLEAISVLDLALQHDPDQPAALLTLAAIYELLVDYPETVALLRRLVKVTPASGPVGAEARLRLGINLARTGSRKAAAERLTASLEPGAPRWVRAVAYEELAVLRADQGDVLAAVELLQQAVERMPRQQRFYIQLAALYETLGDPAAARSVLDRLEERVRRDPGSDRDSPRLRYSQWPEQALEASRRWFEGTAASRMTALAKALADFTARGG